MLIDENVPYDMMYLNAFYKMEIGTDRLARAKNVTSSMDLEIPIIGRIILPVTIERSQKYLHGW